MIHKLTLNCDNTGGKKVYNNYSNDLVHDFKMKNKSNKYQYNPDIPAS